MKISVLWFILFISIWFVSIWFVSIADASSVLPSEKKIEIIENSACHINGFACCKWNICAQTASCIKWTIPVMKWCNKQCMPIIECKKTNILKISTWTVQKIDEKKLNTKLLERLNIKIENKTQNDLRENVKEVKIQKIDDLWSKLENITQKIQTLNYNSITLQNYVDNLNNIKQNISRAELSLAETKKYNNQLKNIINSIKQELSNIKNTYKSQ